MFEAMEHLAYS